jgi:hypothetical protein
MLTAGAMTAIAAVPAFLFNAYEILQKHVTNSDDHRMMPNESLNIQKDE